MADTESSIAIQDEESKDTATILSIQGLMQNGIVILNADGSNIGSGEE